MNDRIMLVAGLVAIALCTESAFADDGAGETRTMTFGNIIDTPYGPMQIGIIAPNNARSDPSTFDGAIIGADGKPNFGSGTDPMASDYNDLGFVESHPEDEGSDGYLNTEAWKGMTAASGILEVNRDGKSNEIKTDSMGELWIKFKIWVYETLVEVIQDITVTGDPGIFSLDGEACTNKRYLGSHESTYWRYNLYSSEPSIPLPMDRELCDGTYMIVIDWNLDGKATTGHEILFSQEQDIFQRLAGLDMLFGNSDGVLNATDGDIWKITHVGELDSVNNIVLNTPSDLGVLGFKYDGYQKFHNDRHGAGVYADNVGVSTEHFRINSWNPDGVITVNGTVPLYGMIVGPLWDCTTNDVRYHVAEKMTGNYLRVDSPQDPTHLYREALEYCQDFEEAWAKPAKYQSHWIAGIASMEHKKGFSDPAHFEKSRELYDDALSMMPSNPFYNVDSCMLEYHMGHATNDCIVSIEKAIQDRPDVEWFAEARDIAVRGIR